MGLEIGGEIFGFFHLRVQNWREKLAGELSRPPYRGSSRCPGVSFFFFSGGEVSRPSFLAGNCIWPGFF